MPRLPPMLRGPIRSAATPSAHAKEFSRFSSHRTAVAAWLFALAGGAVLGGTACHQAPPEPPPAPWMIEALAAEDPAGSSAPGVSLCKADGQGCSALRRGTSFAAGAVVKTARGARATLKLDASTSLDAIDEGSVALLPLVAGSPGVIEVSEGNLLLRRDASEDSASSDVQLRIAGNTLEMAPGAAAIAALRTFEGGRAAVTVRRGSLLVRAGEGAPVEIRAGETARLVPGEQPNKRAAWMGGEAAVNHASVGEAEDRAPIAAPRGLGTITARVPGTTDVVTGVRLISHKVKVVVRDGFARTEVEEEFFNDTPRVLEGRFVFPLPADASIARLALWVGNDLVEGELLERRLAAAIFKGIVDDTVRPRDPALLEWVSGGEFSLKIFPLPAKGSRKVVLAYNQALPTAGGQVRYVYPLSLGADRAATVEDFSIALTAFDSRGRLSDASTLRYPASIHTEEGKLEVAYSARSFAPAADFVVSYDRADREESTEVAVYTPRAGEFAPTAPAGAPGRIAPTSNPNPNTKDTKTPATPPEEPPGGGYVAIRMTADLPDDAPLPAHVRREVAIVIDASHSQSIETLEGEARLAAGLLQQMDPDERFVLMACDSACSSYPETGTAAPAAASIESALRWLKARTPGGSSDIAGALIEAASRVASDGSGQVVYIGDGAPSSGELRADAIGARVKSAIDARKVDLRLLGAGRTVDEVVLEGLARAVGATYERVSTGEPLEDRITSLGMGLRAPVIRGVTLDLPASLRDVYPRSLANLRLGQPILLVGKAAAMGTSAITVRGDLGGVAYSRAKTVVIDSKSVDLKDSNPIVPRLWAESRIRELEAAGDEASAREAIELSKRFHVMSRYTALLVLENDRMFAEFGIRRTTRKAGDQSDDAFSEPTLSPAGRKDVAAPGARWGSAKGGDDETASAGGATDRADSIGDSFGAGGLGLSGVGNGGGGRGEGIGLGSIGVIGRGAGTGTGTGQGFGSGHGRLGGAHKTSPPAVRMGAVSVSGRLPPEVIQRIVRQNFGRFRLCYENGLRSNPNLAGRVGVRFVIGRDGAVNGVSNGGSDLPNADVVACVIRAFNGLTFPAPEGGIVTVVYPIVFSPDGGGTSSPTPTTPTVRSTSSDWTRFAPEPWGPSAAHRLDDTAWATAGEAALEKLRKAVDDAPSSRKRHDALVRGLLSRGRFQEALTRAMRLAELDPDLPAAQELLAYAAAASGDRALALTTVDGLVEASPLRSGPHLRAARAFEAAGDERRACAHWRSVAALASTSVAAASTSVAASTSDDGGLYESLRCRARMVDGAEAVLREARSMTRRSTSVDALISLLAEGKLPRYEARKAPSGSFDASVTCSSPSDRCPTVVVIAPNGTVYSPWTPAPSRGGGASVSLAGVVDGAYRTILVGGDPAAEGELEVRALGAIKRAPLFRNGGRTTVATTVSGTDVGLGSFGFRGFGFGGGRSPARSVFR